MRVPPKGRSALIRSHRRPVFARLVHVGEGESLESWRVDGILHAKVTESDLASPVDLHGAFEDFIFQQGERRIVIDLSDVHQLTSLMIGGLVSLHLLAYENVVLLSFENMSPRIGALFSLIGVDKLMESHYGGDVSHQPQAAAGPDSSS